MGLTGPVAHLLLFLFLCNLCGQKLKGSPSPFIGRCGISFFDKFFAQRSFTQFKTGLLIVIFSAIGSYLTTPFKEMISFWIAFILSIVSLIKALFIG